MSHRDLRGIRKYSEPSAEYRQRNMLDHFLKDTLYLSGILDYIYVYIDGHFLRNCSLSLTSARPGVCRLTEI